MENKNKCTGEEKHRKTRKMIYGNIAYSPSVIKKQESKLEDKIQKMQCIIYASRKRALILTQLLKKK